MMRNVEQLRKRFDEPDMAVIRSQMARDGTVWILDLAIDLLDECERLRQQLERWRAVHDSELGVCEQHCDVVRDLRDACDALEARAEAAERERDDLLAGRANDDRDYQKAHQRIAALERERDEAKGNAADWHRDYISRCERVAALERALRDLCDKLDVIAASTEWQGQVAIAAVHGYGYTGPTWVSELAAARAALEGKP
jgi:chromosome segregation ATPase